MSWELAGCTQMLLDEIASTEMKRADVAMTYALAICSSEKTEWSKVNAAIMARWSQSGLEWIKKLAWKIVKENRQEAVARRTVRGAILAALERRQEGTVNR